MKKITPKILIVDDEPNILQVLSAFLDEQGYQSIPARGLLEARRSLEEGVQPDVVLLDVMLGDGNGVMFVRELRNEGFMKDVPIIMMSAHRTKSEDKVVGLEFGADDYLTKPFDLRELQLRIERLLKQKHMQAIEATPGELGPPSEIRIDLTEALKGVLKKTEPVSVGPPPPEIFVPSSASSASDQTIDPTEVISEKPIVLRVNIKEKLLQLFIKPLEYFEKDLTTSALWLGPALVGLTGVLLGLQHGISLKSWGVGFAGLVVYPLLLATTLAGLVWGLQWIYGLKKIEVPFQHLVRSIGVATAPLVLAGFMGLIYVIAGGYVGDFTAGPLLFVPHQASSHLVGFLLRRLDLFELWSLWMAIGVLHSIMGGARKDHAKWLVGIWLGLVLAGSLIKGFLL